MRNSSSEPYKHNETSAYHNLPTNQFLFPDNPFLTEYFQTRDNSDDTGLDGHHRAIYESRMENLAREEQAWQEEQAFKRKKTIFKRIEKMAKLYVDRAEKSREVRQNERRKEKEYQKEVQKFRRNPNILDKSVLNKSKHYNDDIDDIFSYKQSDFSPKPEFHVVNMAKSDVKLFQNSPLKKFHRLEKSKSGLSDHKSPTNGKKGKSPTNGKKGKSPTSGKKGKSPASAKKGKNITSNSTEGFVSHQSPLVRIGSSKKFVGKIEIPSRPKSKPNTPSSSNGHKKKTPKSKQRKKKKDSPVLYHNRVAGPNSPSQNASKLHYSPLTPISERYTLWDNFERLSQQALGSSSSPLVEGTKKIESPVIQNIVKKQRSKSLHVFNRKRSSSIPGVFQSISVKSSPKNPSSSKFGSPNKQFKTSENISTFSDTNTNASLPLIIDESIPEGILSPSMNEETELEVLSETRSVEPVPCDFVRFNWSLLGRKRLKRSDSIRLDLPILKVDEPVYKSEYQGDLPPLVLANVFSFVPYEDRLDTLNLVCSKWNQVFQDHRNFIWKHLNLYNEDYVLVNVILSRFGSFIVNIRGNVDIAPHIGSIQRHCKQIRSLELVIDNSYNHADFEYTKHFERLIENNPLLIKFRLLQLKLVIDHKLIQQLIRNCKYLRDLSLEFGSEAVKSFENPTNQFSDKVMETIAKKCYKLKYLTLKNCQVTTNQLKNIAEKCLVLESLKVSTELIPETRIDPTQFFSMRQIQDLSLCMPDIDVTDVLLHLKKSHSKSFGLKKVFIQLASNGINADLIRDISKVSKHLTHLEISSDKEEKYPITDMELRELLLEAGNLSSFRLRTPPLTKLNGESMKLFLGTDFELLEIPGLMVDKDSIEMFESKLPKCELICQLVK